MSVMTYLDTEKELIEFVTRAAVCFSEHPDASTYTDSGAVRQGEYFAVRWGLGNDCVHVFRVSEDFNPRIYQQAI